MKSVKALAALLSAAALLGLAACGKPEEKQAPSDNASVAEAPVADLSIGPGGAGGITSAIPMTLDAVRAAAPNFIAAEVQDQVEGDPFTAITLSLGNDEVFRIYPSADRTKVYSIETTSARARGPDGDVVGQSLFRNADPEGVVFCITDFEIVQEHGFSCSTEANRVFWRTYRLPDGYDGPSGPFEAIDPDVASEAMLTKMEWMAR